MRLYTLVALFIFCISLPALSGCASTSAYPPLPPVSESEALNDYALGAGDEIRITVFGEDDLSGVFSLDGNGRVSMPLGGDINLNKKTSTEAETEIADMLRGTYLKKPRVSVDILKYRPFYILGEVKRPGSYPYVAGMSLSNAAALGGGFTYRANKDKILITRDEDEVPRMAEGLNTTVLPGDIIEVQERFF